MSNQSFERFAIAIALLGVTSRFSSEIFFAVRSSDVRLQQLPMAASRLRAAAIVIGDGEIG